MHAKTQHVASLLARATSIVPAVVAQWQLQQRTADLRKYTMRQLFHRHSTQPAVNSSAVLNNSKSLVCCVAPRRYLRHALQAPV